MDVAATGAATLKIGDLAPKLKTGTWVQGQPVKEFQKGKAYIVEFWATWCASCRASIPHLNDLHEKFRNKGLVVIGQDVWERNEASVSPFLKKVRDKMAYRVALDDTSGEEEGAMAVAWMKAADQKGIPTAFWWTPQAASLGLVTRWISGRNGSRTCWTGGSTRKRSRRRMISYGEIWRGLTL